MKKLFELIELAAKIFFLVGFAVYFLWENGVVRFPKETMILAFQFMVVAAPFIITTTLIRWVCKWPTTVSWFTIAFALTSAVGFVFSTRALLIIFGDNNSPLMTKIVLPALVPLLSAVAMLVAIKWYRDRRHQKSAS